MKQIIHKILFLLLLTSCGNSEPTIVEEMSHDKTRLYIGKITLDEEKKKQIDAVQHTDICDISVQRLFRENPTLQGSKKQIEQQQRENDTTFTTEDMLLAGECLHSLKTTPYELLDHVYVEYYHTDKYTIISNIIFDPTDSTRIGPRY